MNEKPHWTARVPLHKVRRLYENDAVGILHDELIDDVGEQLYARCQDIGIVRDAMHGRVHCVQCDTILPSDPDRTLASILSCQCGWQLDWGTYRATYRHLELAGDAEFLDEFIAAWPSARDSRAKWLAIDRLVHRWHWENKQHERAVGRPLAVNLIEGNRKQVIALLDELSATPRSEPELDESRDSWRGLLDQVRTGQRAWNAAKREQQEKR